MKIRREFDVLVVYSGSVARSAALSGSDNAPFGNDGKKENYNVAYAYLLDQCERMGLSAAFSTTEDIVGEGLCQSYWLYQNKTWTKKFGVCYARLIFDKFSPITRKKRQQRKILFGSGEIQPFNNAALAALFFDKQMTYERLLNFTIPTVSLDILSAESIQQKINLLKEITLQHTESSDFTNSIVMKDRYGAGGNNIFKINKNFVSTILHLAREHKAYTFILQPYMQFENGFSYDNQKTSTDIRLIYQNGNIIQTYIRMAKKDDFRCNEHQGGKLIYTTLLDIPKKVLRFSERVKNALNQNTSLYALDYIVSDNGNVYFLEGNIGPGIDWNLSLKKNEKMAKKLIRSIVQELAARAEMIKLEAIKIPEKLAWAPYSAETNVLQI